jgi:hypothetical protein
MEIQRVITRFVMSRFLVLALAVGLSAEAGAQSTTSPEGMDAVQRLETLQARIAALAAQIESADAEVDLLKETALTGEVGRTHVVVLHKDALGASFDLESVRYMLDGELLLERKEGLGQSQTIGLYSGFLESGEHLLEVEATVKSGTFGIFSYAEAYSFNVQSRYLLEVKEGRVNLLDVVFTQKEDISLPPEERLTVRYDVHTKAGLTLEEDGAAVAETR